MTRAQRELVARFVAQLEEAFGARLAEAVAKAETFGRAALFAEMRAFTEAHPVRARRRPRKRAAKAVSKIVYQEAAAAARGARSKAMRASWARRQAKAGVTPAAATIDEHHDYGGDLATNPVDHQEAAERLAAVVADDQR